MRHPSMAVPFKCTPPPLSCLLPYLGTQDSISRAPALRLYLIWCQADTGKLAIIDLNI